MKAALIVCLSAFASAAVAQPLEFTIDPAQSTLDLTIQIDLGGLGGDTDSDSTTISGTISAALDNPAAATQASLHDFHAMMDSDLNFNWVPAFLSTADATLTGGLIKYADPGVVIGPVPVNAGAFEFLDVPVILEGTLDVNYDIFLFGSGSEVIDLSTLDPGVTPISGILVSDESTVTVSNTIGLSASQPLIVNKTELGTVIVTGTATMVAVAQIPSCSPDINNDGQLDFFDISAFLTAFANQEVIADFNNDGSWDFFDISAFLTAFGNGCP